MKKYLHILLLTIFALSCSSKKDDYTNFQLYTRALDFDARTQLSKSVSINTNATEWDYKLVYTTSDTGWCELNKRSSYELQVNVKVNYDESNIRMAKIEFYVNGKYVTEMPIYQSKFAYTDFEKKLIMASEILHKKYSYINLDIDFDSKYTESSSVQYKGVFNYNEDNLNFIIPVSLSTSYFASTASALCWDYVSMTPVSWGSDQPLKASGRIYTGYNSNYDGSQIFYYGNFNINIFGYDDNGKYISIALNN